MNFPTNPRKYLPYSEWPLADRRAWEAAIAPGNVIDGEGPAANWAPATRHSNLQHYSRWLGYLSSSGELDTDCQPEDRVTPEAIRPYVTRLKDTLAPRTVVSSLVGLKVMMKAMAPEHDWRWLADICNALNRTAKPQSNKRARMRPTGKIYATAIAELQRLETTTLTRRVERVAYRDTLMLALMAARPLRLKNFAGLHLDRHLTRENSKWLIQIPGGETKNCQPVEHELPASLIPFLETYLNQVRPSFEKKQPNDAVWLTFEGTPLSYHAIYCRFIFLTTRLFGVPINPHLLRDCAASSLATVSPAAARSAAPLLGHLQFATTERYYIRANQLEVSRALNDKLAKIKTALE